MSSTSTTTPYIEFASTEVFDSPLRQAIQELIHPAANGAIQIPTPLGIGIESPKELIGQL
ncbi:MAG: hypothetical protein AAF702_14560 [Chloroflexota bacterium]